MLLARSGIKSANAPTVQTLLDAGAQCIGKTITDELAFSMNGQNAHFGAPINGAAPDRITGGSSTGSAAAVSHGMCDFALGTDTGGSVRAPANHCNLYGIRPTHGRISLQGALDLSPSYDTCGFFTRDVRMFARVADVLVKADAKPIAKPRLLLPTDVWGLVSTDVSIALESAQRRITQRFGAAQPCAVALDSFDEMYWSFRYIQGREAWQTDGALIERDAMALGLGVKERFEWSKNVTDAQVQSAQTFRARFTEHVRQLLGEDGVLVMPTMPDIAPLRASPEASLQTYRDAAIKMLCISGLSGFPQISLPLSTREGAPLGISLLGPAGSDRSLIAMAEQL